MTTVTRLRLRIEGIVQGVGFRPFVSGLAREYGVSGHVGNDAEGVFAEIEGDRATLDGFLADLERRAPALAVVERVRAEPAAPTAERGFRIVPSPPATARFALISPDMATCEECLAETLAPAGRRSGYPFTNCTDCGPRFSIVADVPYDRHNTTMAVFEMCEACAGEYADADDRRFHAQPVCCPECGPSLRFTGPDGVPVDGEPLQTAVEWLRDGRILAIKGLGGYHLAVLADDEKAVRTLRDRKHREDKPFALMAPDLVWARRLVRLEPVGERVLAGTRRPILLAPRLPGAGVADAVAPGSRELGVMLPYTPLHHLLARRLARPFVLTSGNVSDEPIVCRDDDALKRLSQIADGFLAHDRPIQVRTDDSVVRVFRGREQLVRRSRGYVPAPLTTAQPFPRPVLACGAELKNTFCVAKGNRAFVSHHIGDLKNYETLRSFTEGIAHFRRLFDVTPRLVAHDLHPEYLSTKYALELTDVDVVAVQHHHAHIASCLADNGASGPVIGVAFDGLGFGTDATLWGGELLIADLVEFRRAGHLEPVPMPGGETAVREPWRMAAAYLLAAYGDPPELDLARRHQARWDAVVSLARKGVNAPLTSSAGRLFDAVSAILGVRDVARYEGQAAIELEQRVAPGERDAYPMTVAEGDPLILRSRDLVRGVVDDLLADVPVDRIAARFHNGLARAVVTATGVLRERTGLGTVALSGGVFQNLTLLERVVEGLEGDGFHVLVHSRVPCNDGGISLGQAVVAAARDRSADSR
ncbi:hydrogenase maturation protein HypF [Actinomadura pelletieri DSM 43383]|uniref:Carbamoyltransferase n=1 Tax=Actinomadura pelletieri DSM 43383 TaxID=1120940 RepID=A0A495QY01_9ACTN|nr:carbamoyltransferase HypF [Actinomadura pelletieri]RKS78796.1 hydrogenase maturation protein HypF [Actinomadura pelletieri DSM 43383]